MNHSSVLNLILKSESKSIEQLQSQIQRSAELVTEGRYLITVFNVIDSWEKCIPIETLTIAATLGSVDARSSEWEFFGNGAIRCFKSSNLRLSKTLQWNIVRRIGYKPYSRRPELSKTALTRNTIPVSDKAFTRDVANNVWHLKDEDLTARLVARFSTLLSWNDEDFIVVNGSKTSNVESRTRLDLKGDLVGVPTKIPYLWNSGDVLF
jgi:hypothetical protein